MKKQSIFFVLACIACIFCIAEGAVHAQSITVTAPGTGEAWYKGKTYAITWTHSGSMNANVKIRLYDGSATTNLLAIVDSTPNDGSFNWTVPFSLTPGKYVIRVRTVDNAVKDDSMFFYIRDLISSGKNHGTIQNPKNTMKVFASPASQAQNLTPRPDFKVTSIYKTNNHIVAFKLKNLGVIAFTGPITYNIYLQDQFFGNASNNVNLAGNAEVEVQSVIDLTLLTIDYNDNALKIKVDVDPGNQIIELNENNNSLTNPQVQNIFRLYAAKLSLISLTGDSTNKYCTFKFEFLTTKGLAAQGKKIRYQISSDIPSFNKTDWTLGDPDGLRDFIRSDEYHFSVNQVGAGPHWIQMEAWTDLLPYIKISSQKVTF